MVMEVGTECAMRPCGRMLDRFGALDRFTVGHRIDLGIGTI